MTPTNSHEIKLKNTSTYQLQCEEGPELPGDGTEWPLQSCMELKSS